LKESSGDTRRITDLHNTVGDRYAIFTGVDNLALECSILGIDGWVAGSGIAFPEENQYFWELTRKGDWEKAREIYRWFTPLLHLDVHTKFVQYIKLAVQEAGLGSEWVRPPRLPLSGEERKKILQIIRTGIENRPTVPKRKKAR
jgi:dihydrodipicolinate synthase/N-acetylneuraminate lyase